MTAALHPRSVLPAAAVEPDPRVGAVVLTHNRPAELMRTLERLRALPERPAIVVVDNASREPVAPLVAARFPGVRCVALSRNAGAAGRNAGVRACPRPYVALCDDDTWWEPGSLRRAADLLDAHPRVALLNATVLVGPQNRLDPTCRVMARSPLPRSPDLPGVPLLGFMAGASVVRRDAFLAAGGFAPRLFLGGEERLLAIDLVGRGWALLYRDDLYVHHHPSPQRDAAGRRRLLHRNQLWTAWLRRSARTACAETVTMLAAALHDADARAGLIAALPGLPWALRYRRAPSPAIEAALRSIDRLDRAAEGGELPARMQTPIGANERPAY